MWPFVTSTKMSAGWVCVLLAAVTADEITVYKKVGDDVVLKPRTAFVPGTITNIMWKDGPNIAAQWEGTEIDLYRQFEVRGSLNISSGEMTIKGLTHKDTGVYTPEINNVIASRTNLFVISAVPVPTVIKSCDDEETCKLTCDGDTTDAGPITYRWMSDDKVLTDSSKEKHITKENSSSINEFSCELKNPVSQESSPPITNPFITTSTEPGGNLKISTGVIVFFSLLAALLMLVFIHKCKAGMWFFQKASMPWEADFWRKNERTTGDAASKGTYAHQEKGETDEESQMT